MNGDVTGLEQGGLIGPCLRARPAGTLRKRRAEARRRTPCGVWAAARTLRSTVSATCPSAIRLIVSVTGRTGIAAPCSAAAARTARTRSAETTVARRRGRARPGRRPRILAVERLERGARPPRPTRGAAVPAGARRRPPDSAATAHRGSRRLGRARATTTIRSTASGQRRARRSTRQAAAGRRRGEPACRPPPSDSTRRRQRRSRRPDVTAPIGHWSVARRRAGRQSRRGWAKIIRPATVWRTRVTATSRSLSM